MLPEKPSKIVGRVVGLWRYPVKSMAAETLQEVNVSWFGLAADRRWAFVRAETSRNGFPWLTIRERPDLNHYQPVWVDPANPERSPLRVRTPAGAVFDIDDPALAAELYPGGVRVMKQNRGIFDTFPISLITTQTIHQLGKSVGMSLDVQRFRPNFLIEATGDQSYPEDRWVGRMLRLGSLRLRIDKRDGRCVVVTVDPVTSEKNTAILRTIAKDRQGCLGVYGTAVRPGVIKVGDPVFLE